MTHTQFIKNSFEIKKPKITFTKEVNEKRIKDIKHVIYYGYLTYTPKGCLKCGIINQSHAEIVKNGAK